MSAKPFTTRLVANALQRTGLLAPMSAVASRLREAGFAILTFHRVNDDDDPFMPALPTGVFSAWMEHIARNYVVLTVEDLVERVQERRLPRAALGLTFDDGYQDNLTHAAPILARYGLRATIFLATGYVGTREALWFDRLALAVKKATCPEIRLTEELVLPLRSKAERLQALRTVLAHLKQLPDLERRRHLERLFSKLEAGPSDTPKRLMLTWEEVDALRGLGFSVGAHTVSHPILSQLSAEDAWQEINGSKVAIEKATGTTPRAFAYPNGGYGDYDEGVARLVRRAGFTCAVTTRRGRNTATTPPFELRRGGPWEHHLPTYALKLAHYQLTGV